MTRADIQAIIRDEPTLTTYGFGCFSDMNPDYAIPNDFQRSQDDLLDKSENCRLICNWLVDVQMIKAINRRHSSYGLKHWVEKTLPSLYCSNGEFICSAIFMGFDYRKSDHCAYFNMSQKSLNRKWPR